MKTSIIFLGLVALTFTTAKAATEFDTQVLDQQESATVIVEASNNNGVANETDTAVFNPNSVIKSTYVKTVEEVVAENNQITESGEETVQPLSIATTIDRIAEDNQVIESNISNEVYPLDFEKINHAVKSVTVYNNTAITVDLKL